MKITKFETMPIEGRAMILKMHTDEGLTGFGEPMNYEHWRVVAQAVEDMAEYLVGKDPFQIEDHWQAMYRSSYTRSMPILVGALSGIEMAMWDVMGKALGVPVWKLFGGSVRRRVRVYTGIGGGDSPASIAEVACQRVSEGFTALKMGGSPRPVRYVDNPKTIKEVVARVAAVREAVGDEVDIAVDLHRRFSPAMATIVVRELEPFHLMFAEEPCHPENDKPPTGPRPVDDRSDRDGGATSDAVGIPRNRGDGSVCGAAAGHPSLRRDDGAAEDREPCGNALHRSCTPQRGWTRGRRCIGSRDGDGTEFPDLRGRPQTGSGSVQYASDVQGRLH